MIPIQTLRHLTQAEQNNPTIKVRMNEFTNSITKRMGDNNKQVELSKGLEPYPEHDPDLYQEYQSLYDDEVPPTPDIDDIGHDPALLVDAEVILPHQGSNIESAP